MSTKTELEYRLPLPTPAQAKSLAAGIEAAISPTIKTSLAELAAANASGDGGIIKATAEAVISKFDFTTTVSKADKAGCERFTIYDTYFALERLPDDAPKKRGMEALTVALAVVMKDAAEAEAEKRGVTSIEFGTLRQALAVVIEVLSETQSINS